MNLSSFPRVVVCELPMSQWKNFEIQIATGPCEFVACENLPIAGARIRIFFRCFDERFYVDGTLELVETRTFLGSRIVILGTIFDSQNMQVKFEKELNTSIGKMFLAS